MTHQTPEEFGEAFDSFRSSAFRLELLGRYFAANEAEPFRRFLAGEPQDPEWREPWKRLVRDAARDGKRMARVHVVGEPLTDYLRFELTCAYPANVEAGEDVRILQSSQWAPLTLPQDDFWLFDDREAAFLIYDADGNFQGAETTSDPAVIADYREARDLAMRHSVPLADYLASLGMKEAV
jgi:hypothetical protein